MNCRPHISRRSESGGGGAEVYTPALRCFVSSMVLWNEAVDMTTKLYGPPHELERTAAFIAKAGIAV
ncbi:hypothetical protein RRG08_057754 [Elysia crispata]|uniref:Uncharacterized protein n=1 Tax=Elysia crispata TaxID=231223 RepID=A0AAE0YHF2_9GAST|nr:hypothetical protein RRG08_057754 [Elysia crispata]